MTHWKTLIVALAAAAAGACAGTNPAAPTAEPVGAAAVEHAGSNVTSADAPAPDRATERFEVTFMKTMIDHHSMAVQMSEICLDKAIHGELRAKCEDIIRSQTEEIQTLQEWLRDWYEISYTPKMKPSSPGKLAVLRGLDGERFEIRFMEMMINHHRMAIGEAEECVEEAYHTPLVNMCHNIIRVQSAEIQQFRSWLCAWYDRCSEE